MFAERIDMFIERKLICLMFVNKIKIINQNKKSPKLPKLENQPKLLKRAKVTQIATIGGYMTIAKITNNFQNH